MTSDPFQPAANDPAGRPAPAASPFASPDAAPGTAPAAPAPSTPVEPVRTVAVRSRRGGSGMLVNALLGVALVVAVGGVAFAAGRATAPASAAAAGRTGNGQGGGFFAPGASGAPGGRGGFGGGGGSGGTISVQGTVEAIDGSSITIKTTAGTTVTLSLNGDTSYHKQAAATAADVTTGSTVIVQLEGRGGNGQRGPSASAAPSASGAPTDGFGTAGSVTVVP